MNKRHWIKELNQNVELWDRFKEWVHSETPEFEFSDNPFNDFVHLMSWIPTCQLVTWCYWDGRFRLEINQGLRPLFSHESKDRKECVEEVVKQMVRTDFKRKIRIPEWALSSG
jgi:hypothetical protein